MKIQELRGAFEQLDGWIWLPRYIDKIRLNQRGKLPPDYVECLGSRTDGLWLAEVGLSHEGFAAAVRDLRDDNAIIGWLRPHVAKSPEEKVCFNQWLADRPDATDRALLAWFQKRKADYGLSHRTDITTLLHLVEADEGRM
ncbi:MAG: DUF5069 domain-containing protein [Puniceicoccaceae bacterium]